MSALISTTDAGGSPDVPDATATVKWKQYLWVRQAGSATIPKVYAWNEYGTSDTTYLKWQEKVSLDSGSVTNSHVNASAAIVYSKLSLTDGVVNADINSAAEIDSTKLATIPHSKLNLTGEVLNADLAGSIDEAKLAGSIPIGKLTLTSSAGITNSHINTGAAIDSAKLASIPIGKLTLTESAGIIDDHVGTGAGISYSKLSVGDGDIPFSALEIGNGDISNLKIDTLYEKRLSIQGSQSSSGGVLTVPDATKQLDGIYRGIMTSSGDQVIVLPDPEKANAQIDDSNGYADGDTSLTVDSLPQALYAGQVITFAGEQTFTLSANASAGATTIAGKLVAATTLTDNSKGYIYDGTSFRLSIYKAGGTGKVSVRIEGFTPTAGTYTGENLTLTLPAGHGISTADKVTVTGVTPTYYNVVKAQVTNATNTQITYVNQASTTPSGNATGFGLVRRSEKLVNNSTGVLSDAITVLPTTASAENKKVLLHCIADSNRGDGQWLIGGVPSYSSFHLQAEEGQTYSNERKLDLPTNTKYFKVNETSEAVGTGVDITVDSTHGTTAVTGDKIMFEGGGVLTLTAGTASNGDTLTGDLILFGVVNDERGHMIPRDEDGNILESGRTFVTATGMPYIVP